MTNPKKTTPAKQPKAADLDRLARNLKDAEEHHSKVEQALSLAGHRAEAAKWGLQLPDGFDSMEAAARYHWLQEIRPKFASVPPEAGVKAWQRLQIELIGPLQTGLADSSKALSAARDEHARARNLHDIEHADELIGDLQGQIGLATKAVKQSAANVKRLNDDLNRLTLEQAEHAAAVQLNDEQLALAVAAGQPVNRSELVNSEAVAASISKLLTVTRQAVQKAQQAAKTDRDNLAVLEGEKTRLIKVKTRQRIVKGLAAFIGELGSEGIDRRELESVLQSAHTLGLDRILVEAGKA